MSADALGFYSTPGPMTGLPGRVEAAGLPGDLDEQRAVVQGVLVHRDWVQAYGVEPGPERYGEPNLRTVPEVLARLFELSAEPVTVARRPADRVIGICRHFALLHTALLRGAGTPARVRCGFAGYFDAAKWYDHWITERWDGHRWVRDDPQIDEVQRTALHLDFDPYDQPTGRFLTGAEAWAAVRAGELDAGRFGIFDMWGLAFVAGNVLLDLACLNKVELLPWDVWGLRLDCDPHVPLPDEMAPVVDEVAALVSGDDHDAIRGRYQADDRLRVPADILTIGADGVVPAHLLLDEADGPGG